MPRHDSDEEYVNIYYDGYNADDDAYHDGHHHEDYRRLVDRTPPPRPRHLLASSTRRDRSRSSSPEEIIRSFAPPIRITLSTTRSRTPSPSAAPSSAPPLSEGSSAAAHRNCTSLARWHPHRSDHPQNSVSSAPASRSDVAGNHDAASSLEGSVSIVPRATIGRRRASPPDTSRANRHTTGGTDSPPPRYSSPPRDESLEERAVRIADLLMYGNAYVPTPSELEAVRTVFPGREEQADGTMSVAGEGGGRAMREWDDDDDGVSSGKRLARMKLEDGDSGDVVGRVDRYDRARYARAGYVLPGGAGVEEEDYYDLRKGVVRRRKRGEEGEEEKEPPLGKDPLRRDSRLPVNEVAAGRDEDDGWGWGPGRRAVEERAMKALEVARADWRERERRKAR